jgi:hypothetical protein
MNKVTTVVNTTTATRISHEGNSGTEVSGAALTCASSDKPIATWCVLCE